VRLTRGGIILNAWLTLLDNSFYSGISSPLFNQLNRSNLHWDNYDGFFDYSSQYSNEENNWLLNDLNGVTTFDSKIVAYAGSISPPWPSDLDYTASLLGGEYGMPSDGVVPIVSAQFDGHLGAIQKKYLPDYDHYEMVTGKGSSDNVLFPWIKETILSAPVLPVQLTDFRAVISNQSVELMWHTATEINNYGFEVERNSDSLWRKIGFLEGNGTTNSPKEYSFQDKTFRDGKYTYRLKQIDRDGKFKYSQSVEVEISIVPKVFALEQNYPNPFNPTTIIRYDIPKDTRVKIVVFDMLGRQVKTLVDEETSSGRYKVQFNASDLSSGVYFYRLLTSDFIQTKKLLLMR
jgi:hypothetical protein